MTNTSPAPETPTEVIQDENGIIRVKSTMEIVTCSWTLGCTADAVDVRPHPILGGIPVCTRHES